MAKGKQPSKALSPVGIRNLVEPGRYADGGGLYLVVDPSGAKRWLLRTVVRGRRRDIGLGGLSVVSLAEAREEAMRMRAAARRGEDPLMQRKMQREVVPTFREAAATVHAAYAAGWRNPKHAAQWLSSLSHHAFAGVGDLPVNVITTSDVLKVLMPIWLKKPETARRVRQRMSTVMDWAKAAGYAPGENPVDGVGKGLPRQTEPKSHHAALPFAQVADFVGRLRAAHASETVKLAFEFLILTAARTGEVIVAKSAEIDLLGRVWVIPAERMKARREHRVPLSDRAVEILGRAKLLAGASDFVFPGASPDKPISNMAFLMLLRRLGDPITAHGFRSCFRDWAAEKTSFSREVCEMALAHTVRDKTEAAYRRGDLFDKRRQLMSSWSRHVAPKSAKLLQLVS